MVVSEALSDKPLMNADLPGLWANLESLRLGDAQVTDAGLKHLEGLTNLEYLGLGDTPVTLGIERLRHVLPNCTISEEQP